MFLVPSNKIDNKKLLDSFEIIRDEYLSLMSEDFIDYISVREGINNILNNGPSNNGESWQVYPIIYKSQVYPYKKKLRTAEILMDLGVTPILSAFSNLAGNSEIAPHRDYDENTVGGYSKVIKYHLSLSTPVDGECMLGHGVGQEREARELKAGDLNVFDESITHWVKNNGSSTRGVLLISFLKKDIY